MKVQDEIIALPYGQGPTTQQLHALLKEQGEAARERGSQPVSLNLEHPAS